MFRRFSFLLLLGVSACSVKDAACGKPAPESGSPLSAVTGESANKPANATFNIVLLGDSLTAGFGLLTQQTFPAKLEPMFADAGYATVEIVNAGLSGDTTAGGLRRVESLLDSNSKILVVALGGNDALRGISIADTRENLRQIIEIAQARGVLVMLCGMQAPTNLGEDYQTAFKQLTLDLLRAYQRQIQYVPFLLEGVAGKPELNQPDGIHPNEKGSQVIADLLFPQLKGMVDRLGGG